MYVINLPKDQQRKKHMLEMLRQLQLKNVEIVPAVNGLRLSDSVKSKSKLTAGETGCYFSHIRACKKLLEDNENCALILEDDVGLAKGVTPERFQSVFAAALAELPPTYCQLYLERCFDSCGKRKRHSKHLVALKQPLCAGARLVSQRGALALLQAADVPHPRKPIDVVMRDLVKQGKLESYGTDPMLLTQSKKFASNLRMLQAKPECTNALSLAGVGCSMAEYNWWFIGLLLSGLLLLSLLLLLSRK